MNFNKYYYLSLKVLTFFEAVGLAVQLISVSVCILLNANLFPSYPGNLPAMFVSPPIKAKPSRNYDPHYSIITMLGGYTLSDPLILGGGGGL